MRFTRPRSVTALATVVALGVVAALGGGTAGLAASPATAAPQPGGTFTIGILPPCGLDKAQTSGCNFANVDIVDNLTEQLLDGTIEPWLATSWEISDDATEFTFHLREDVTFSNGEAFDAEVLKLNFDNIIELGELGKSFQASAYLLGYEGTEVLDTYTARVTFSQPKAGLLQALSEKPLGIIAPETILTKTPEERFAEGVIGSGPFVIEEVVPDERFVVVRREGYAWPSPRRLNQGPAYLDRVIFQVLPEDSVRTGSLFSGHIDAANTIPATDIAPLRAAGFEIVARASAGVPYTYYPNVQDPILGELAVRQAIQIALDRDELHDVVFDEFRHTPTSVLSSTHPNWIDLSADLAHDSDRARQLLEDAGWVEGANGIYERDGVPLSISIKYSATGDTTLNELVQLQLRQVGIDLRVEQLTAAEVTEARISGNWQLLYGNLTRPDGDVLVSAFHPDFATNFSASYDEELEELLERQTAELDVAARQELIEQIQHIIVTRGYAFPTTEAAHTVAYRPGVHDVGFQAPWWPTFADTWIES